MLDLVIFGASAFMAQVLTNLDNVTALVALMMVSGPRRTVLGFLLAQILVILAAFVVALGVDDVVPHWAGYLGVIPLSLGLIGVYRHFRRSPDHGERKLPPKASVVVTVMLFFSLSMDTFAVLAPLLADSTPQYRAAGIVGAVSAALGLTAVGLLSARTPIMTGGLARRLETLVPYVMICAGLYILSNSWTDAI